MNFRRIEKYSCWSILSIDGVEIEAKIIHKGRGKFKIVEDKHKSKYINKIVDASDVICCKVKPDKQTIRHSYRLVSMPIIQEQRAILFQVW